MHGLICKSLESFVATTHGPGAWDRVRLQAGLDPGGFEALLTYDDAVFAAALRATSDVLDRCPTGVMEDVGGWIFTHPPLEPIRRLFRFCGATFLDVLYALAEVDARARLALPGLELPDYDLRDLGGGRFEMRSDWAVPGAGGVLTGVLRALASEHGALVLLEADRPVEARGRWSETVRLQLYDDDFHAPRAFALGEVGSA